MILEKINSPKDLKNLKTEELNALSREIRDLIVKVVAKKGGHLASSLGAVELTVALHYLLDTPRDTIIFDVGHQIYAHKILTGRREAFVNLREYRGISGFPNSTESPYDTYISGHASTAVSWAQGIAEAKKLKNNNSKTVAIVGDGSLTGGMCFEALNACGHTQSDCMVILNHNEMSISPSVGALSNYLVKLTSMPVYNRIKNELESFLEHFAIAKKLTIKAKKFEEALKGLIVPGIFFEELGFRYFGPIDGHDFNKLIPTIKNVVSLKGPRILHIITKKGKGYKSSENNPEDFHSAGNFDVATGASLKEAKDGFGEIFSKKLIELAKKDKKIVAITAAMPKGTGLHLFKEQFPDRLYDVGIAESHAVGFASGLAKGGIKPVVALYSTF
ncbi:MAG: 1-deoxy-D-xylulose-5-phosphate synthase, partial [Candidatus Omnitrophica bacterium]|nr:1-deoxy-D-xylulose-5-phosphate synthase [Candidatus Omnitrophota bacterium]